MIVKILRRFVASSRLQSAFVLLRRGTGASLVVKKAEIVFIADDILRYILPECKFSLITILHIINPIQTELTSDMQLNNIYKLILD